MRHPEKGDALKAVTVMQARVAVTVEPTAGVTEVGDVSIDVRSGDAQGGGMDAYHRTYGDLFDLGESVSAGMALTNNYLRRLFECPEDAQSVIISLYLQAKGIGVLEERLRWERRDA